MIDDTDIFQAIKIWTGSKNAILRDLSLRMLNRKLFKTYCFSRKCSF
ncbi:metal dependent phosphohydrolase [Calderihabitans maritimus]|uniref:Metal dependent phosphohydrolase n=1 Tax=Calderihabitans maritimus TaxID=1246530 RepID=A0A1Z5HRF3_9FIRM|nr:metal dependent phosphohydrolase [Calderihabitans maritimus]